MELIKITEGQTKLWVPDAEKYKLDSKMPVFFNPVMRLNRDITVDVVKTLDKPKSLDLLSGTGAKGLRLAVEANSKVDLNDANPSAAKLIKRNAKLNKVSVEVFNDSANKLLRKSRRTYDFIDVDPFGTPVPFLQESIAHLRKGGILGVTATDTSALCGTYPKACMRKYESLNRKTQMMFEIGTRILIKKVVSEGLNMGVALEPVFVHSSNHYMRVYLRRVENLRKIRKNLKFLFLCSDCFTWKFEDKLPETKVRCGCGTYSEVLGPLWTGSLYDKKLLKQMSDSNKTVQKIKEEVDVFGYYDYHMMSKKLEDVGELPKMDVIIEKIRKKGFKASRTHFSPTGIKTNLPAKSFLRLLYS